jgi:formylglycine-generating enzyme required for sulfatase activity
LAGNVWEWVADWYSDTYYQNSPLSNPLGPDHGLNRVMRGGGFYYDAHGVRVFSRAMNGPDSTYFDIGFRCASEVAP